MKTRKLKKMDKSTEQTEKKRLSFFKYKFDKGPVSKSKISEPTNEGNCRFALQDFFFVLHKRYFEECELLNPAGYLHTGSFLKKEYANDFFDNLPTGAVIYAEKTRNRKNELVDNTAKKFESEDDYIIALHSAIYIKNIDERILSKLPSEISAGKSSAPAIWHATAVEGATCLWDIDKFLHYYKPIVAK